MTGCPENWEEHSGHCYLWGDKPRSWYKAEEFCEKEGGHLASVTSEAANEYIFEGKEKRKHANIWLGGSDQEEEGGQTVVPGTSQCGNIFEYICQTLL